MSSQIQHDLEAECTEHGVEAHVRTENDSHMPCPELWDADKATFFAHISRDKCERCVLALCELDEASRRMLDLMRRPPALLEDASRDEDSSSRVASEADAVTLEWTTLK